MIRSLADARFAARRRMLDSQIAGGAYLRARPAYRGALIEPSTNIVIDGYPRSANSYAKFAFEIAQGTSEGIAGHTHSAWLLGEAARRGLPAMVLVREPGAVAASMVQMVPGLEVGTVLDGYLRFYNSVKQVRHRLVVASFEEVIEDFGAVIRRVNNAFDVDFRPYERSEENEARVTTLLEASDRQMRGALSENSVSRPSSKRRSADQVLRSLTRREREKLASAKAVYANFAK